MSNFKLVYLKEVADSQTGPFGSQLHQSDYVSKGTPMVTVEHLGVERFTHQNLPFVSDKDRDRLSKYILKEGDIVFSRVGSVDRCTYVTKEEDGWMFSGRCIRVRTNDDANGRYLNFYFRQDSFKKMMLDISVGATMPSLNTKLMDNIPLRLPNIHTQQKIAKVLSDLDAKIEINCRINTELESMAKTLYDYWFVQFDFPDANGKPYKTSGGKMVWNEELKREIPVGWEDGCLSDIANITMGQSPPGESYNEEGKGMIFYQGCTDFGNRYPTIRKFTTSPTRFAKQGDILLSVRAPVGTLNISKEDCCIGRGLACMNSKNDAITYLFGVMTNLKQTFDRRNVSGTTFGAITKDDLFSLPVIIPNEKTIRAFQNLVFPAFEKQNKIELENIELASLRDWLLPMLMNGQVSVGDVEVELGMVAEEREHYGK
jgi:type I restriction enzyme S subunit